MSGTRGARILLVAMNYAPELSGTAPYTTAWARHMAQRHDVAVLAGPPHYPEWRIHDGYDGWRRSSTIDGVHVHRLRHFVPSRTSAPARLAHETTFAARVLAEHGRIRRRPDLVLAVTPPLFGAAAAAALARRLRVPFGLVVQDVYTAGLREIATGAPRGAARAIEAVERRVLRSAASVLTIHERFGATLRALGVPPAGIDIVGNWVHIPQATGSGAEQRARLGWGEEFVVLHAGNMGAKQGLDTVVEAARLADDGDLPLRYVLMGDGNQRPGLERLAAGVRRLQFLPSVDSAAYADILKAADLLLINERPEVTEMSLPSKLTSYCAAGRPILAATGRSGATAAAVTSTGAGLVIAPGRPDAMNQAALRLSADPVRAAGMGRHGAVFAEQHQSSVAAMTGYDRWLDGLLAASPDPRQPQVRDCPGVRRPYRAAIS